jgi:uncharacterized protein YecT (DUF1311 family)
MLSFLLAMLAAPTGGENFCADANTTAELVECTTIVLGMAHQQMTHDWQQALTRMRRKDSEAARLGRAKQPTYSAALFDSQRKWLSFRDSQCRLESFRMRGGSGEGYSQTSCLITLTNERAAALRNIDF